MDVRKWNPMCSKKVNINLSVKAVFVILGLIYWQQYGIVISVS